MEKGCNYIEEFTLSKTYVFSRLFKHNKRLRLVMGWKKSPINSNPTPIILEPSPKGWSRIIRSCLESSGVARSRSDSESCGVDWNRSKSELTDVVWSRLESYGVGVVRNRPSKQRPEYEVHAQGERPKKNTQRNEMPDHKHI